MTMTLAELDPRRRLYLETCVHESSHAIAGALHGATLRSAVAYDNPKFVGVVGRCVFETGEGAGYPSAYEAEIAYSASYGQAKFRAGGRRPTARQVAAVFSTTGRLDAVQLGLLGGSHIGQGVTLLIDRHWNSVIALAKQLHRQGEVHHQDVLDVLGIRDGGGRTSNDLAILRNGGTLSPITPKAPVPA